MVITISNVLAPVTSLISSPSVLGTIVCEAENAVFSGRLAPNAHFSALASQKPLAAKPTIGDLAPFEDTKAFLGRYSLAFEFNGGIFVAH